ncbi:hypothetical protein Taro_041146 [Colocasia esculenta]|uniref:Uncharacterized protein n=1 Tax=Colocasia esculenta TaxID=4460 RepID=A0A843WZW8_COLES|nr:hypothetical protein [Colocasia esculenta]
MEFRNAAIYAGMGLVNPTEWQCTAMMNIVRLNIIDIPDEGTSKLSRPFVCRFPANTACMIRTLAKLTHNSSWRDMELASIHARVSERLGINMQENMLKYLLPIDGNVEQHIMQNFNDQCAGKYAAPFKKLLRKILQCIAYAITEQE